MFIQPLYFVLNNPSKLVFSPGNKRLQTFWDLQQWCIDAVSDSQQILICATVLSAPRHCCGCAWEMNLGKRNQFGSYFISPQCLCAGNLFSASEGRILFIAHCRLESHFYINIQIIRIKWENPNCKALGKFINNSH